MTIKEVCEKYHVSPDALRYYERVGMIPAIHRTKSGIRDYTEQDLDYVETAICMRSAGVPVEMVGEYMRMCQQGDETIPARRDLLKQVREELQNQMLPIIGVTKVAQVEDAAKAAAVELTADEIKALENVADEMNLNVIRGWEKEMK